MGLVNDLLEAARLRAWDAFEDYAEFRPVDWADYRASIAAGLVGGGAVAIAQLKVRPLAVDRSGGYLMVWPDGPSPSCIVYVGAHGERYVAARDERELATLLPYGALVHDAMKRCFDGRGEPQPPPTDELTRAALDAIATSTAPSDQWVAHMIAEVESRGIVIERDMFASVATANRAVLAGWLGACERVLDRGSTSEPEPARPPRPYRASETFQIGDAIEHVSFGLGRVVASPKAAMIEVSFEAGSKVLVHGKHQKATK